MDVCPVIKQRLEELGLEHGDLAAAAEVKQLHGAILQGAVLRDARLDGAELDGADFRGALGLSPAQVCSAVGWRGAQPDPNLQQEVELRCGSAR